MNLRKNKIARRRLCDYHLLFLVVKMHESAQWRLLYRCLGASVVIAHDRCSESDFLGTKEPSAVEISWSHLHGRTSSLARRYVHPGSLCPTHGKERISCDRPSLSRAPQGNFHKRHFFTLSFFFSAKTRLHTTLLKGHATASFKNC